MSAGRTARQAVCSGKGCSCELFRSLLLWLRLGLGPRRLWWWWVRGAATWFTSLGLRLAACWISFSLPDPVSPQTVGCLVYIVELRPTLVEALVLATHCARDLNPRRLSSGELRMVHVELLRHLSTQNGKASAHEGPLPRSTRPQGPCWHT